MPEQKIPISQLKIGMYVTWMDVSWLKTPFISHKKVITNATDIELLKQSGIQYVKIDPEKGAAIHVDDQTIKISTMTKPMEAEKVIPDSTTTLSNEFNAVLKLKDTARKSMNHVFNEISTNQSVVISDITPVVDQALSSILRNSQAITKLMHLKQKDVSLFNHAFNVMGISLLIAQQLEFDEQQLRMLGMAALLHDIGWLRIPIHLMRKGKPYTDQEKILVHNHISLARSLLKDSTEITDDLMRIITEHHERCDGSGYPDHLKNAELHPMSRIIAIADRYDEIVHGLFDQQGMIAGVAIKLLFKEVEQNKLDKELLNTLIHLLGIYPVTSVVMLDTGEKALVVDMNRAYPLLPKVKILYGKSKFPMQKPFVVDLSRQAGKVRKIIALLDPDEPGIDPSMLLRPVEEE